MGKLTGCDNDFASWFGHPVESLSYQEVQFK